MTNERVLVSYQAPPALLGSEHWKQIHKAIVSQLPLRNLHWKSPSRPIKTIQELAVDLEHLDSLHDEHTSQVPASMLEKPLLNIYVVACEDTDFDGYKGAIKKQIKDWHTVVTGKKHQEWLILHVVRPDTRTPSGNFFQMKYSVFERIKTDFNAERRDRCVQLAWSALNDNPAVWADLVSKMKDGLLSAFESAVSQREEDVRRSESQRQMPGWNFCTFFILKESLAASYEGLGLCEDALAQYEELEASFQQVLKDRNSSWFGALIQPGPRDDSSPFLSTDKKPYRDLILANTISVFDLRSYILARQCNLLRKLGRVSEVGRKVVSFLSAFGRRLRDAENLPQLFIESWIYSSCMSTVEQCDSWTLTRSLEAPALARLNACKGELLELALTQLEIIGVATGHLPREPPFTTTDTSSIKSIADTTQITFSNAELLEAVRLRESYDRTYVDLTNRAIDMCAKAGRRKFALKLHGRLAAIDLLHGRIEAARTTFASLPSHYAPHMWTGLEAYMLCRALHAHSQGSSPSGRDWVSLVLSFLNLCVDEAGMALVSHDGTSQNMISDLVASLSKAASDLDPELVYPDHPGVQIKLLGDARVDDSKDGSCLDIVIYNRFPCSIPSCEIAAVITGRENEVYRLTVHADEIPAGKTNLTLFSPSVSAGIYLLDFTELQMSGLLMRWPHKKTGIKSSKAPTYEQSLPIPVRVPLTPEALNIRLAQPRLAKLGDPSQVLVILSSGRNNINEAILRLTGVGGVTLLCREATVSDSSYALQLSDDAVTIHGIPEGTEIEFIIPYAATTTLEMITVTIGVDYATASEPSIRRFLQTTQTLVTPLPLVINVQDFFRGSRLFSKFTISATTHQSVRISSVDLKPSDNDLNASMITKASLPKHGITTITPTQPAHYLFHLDPRAVPETLQLVISYRILREEVELLVEQAVNEVLSDLEPIDCPCDRHTLKSQIVASLSCNSSWVAKYCIAGRLDVPSREDNTLGSAYHAVVTALSSRQFDLSQPMNWRELVIPVDVPRKNVIASVEVSLFASDSYKPNESLPLYAGQPIPTSVTIRTTFGWGYDSSSPRHYILRYDIEEMTSDWLLSGQKRGEFKAEHESSFTISVTLIALHHGELKLPRVTIQALPIQGRGLHASAPSMDVHEVDGARTVLVLPRGGRSTFVVEMGR